MKKKFYVATSGLFLLAATSSAQVEKKQWLLGGDFAVANGSTSSQNAVSFPTGISNSTSNTGLAPHVGYAIGKNSVVGLNLDFMYTDNFQDRTSSFLVNPFYRRFFPFSGRLGIYGDLSAGYGFLQLSYLIYDSAGSATRTHNHYHEFDASLVPGIYYLVGRQFLARVACASILYNYFRYSGEETTTSLSINIFQSFTVGFDIMLGGRK
ncbi:MAG TPA: hypothetical protein VKR32_04420 [Puia sp.]|nr:hypothetical protein [Puia sp.]